MTSPRTILHCDMDAFYAAIEQRDRPELRGKPVIVGHPGKRGVVSTGSYEARVFGVRSAMPSVVAKRLCPSGIWVTPRMKAYVAESARIFEIFEEHTPLVEGLSLDEAFLDVTASEALFGSGETIGRRIQARVREATRLSVSVGVAAVKFVAKVASDLRKPEGLVVVPPGTEEAFLAPLPVSRLWGAGKVTQRRFEELGLRTIGQVQSLTRDELASAVGQGAGEHFFALCHARDPRAVVPDRDAKSMGRENTFEDDVVDDDVLEAILLEQSESVGARLRREGARGSVVHLKLRHPPFVTLTRQRSLEHPTHDDLEIFRAALDLLKKARPSKKPVRLLGVSVGGIREGAEPRQPDLFEKPGAREKSERALRAVDAIRERFGKSAIRHGVPRPPQE